MLAENNRVSSVDHSREAFEETVRAVEAAADPAVVSSKLAELCGSWDEKDYSRRVPRLAAVANPLFKVALLEYVRDAEPNSSGRCTGFNYACIHVLGEIGGAGVAPVLLRFLDDSFGDIALAKLENCPDPVAVEPLLRKLASGRTWTVRKAIEILGKIGDQRAFGPLKQIIDSSADWDMREAAAEALLPMGLPPDSRPWVPAYRVFRSEREPAAAICGLAALFAAETDSAVKERIRCYISKRAWECTAEDVIPALERALEFSQSAPYRRGIFIALEDMRSPAGLRAVFEHYRTDLDGGMSEVRDAGGRWIGLHTLAVSRNGQWVKEELHRALNVSVDGTAKFIITPPSREGVLFGANPGRTVESELVASADHTDGMCPNTETRFWEETHDFPSHPAARFLRGTIAESHGFVRLDPPNGVDAKELSESGRPKLCLDFARTAAFLAESESLDGALKLVFLDSVREIFGQSGLALPQELTVGEFAALTVNFHPAKTAAPERAGRRAAAEGPPEFTWADDFSAVALNVSVDQGLHARTGGAVARIAALWAPDLKVSVRKGGRAADAADILDLMALGVERGDRIEITARGGSFESRRQVLAEIAAVAASDSAAGAPPSGGCR